MDELQADVEQSQLHGSGQKLSPEPGVHHGAQLRVERPYRAGDPSCVHWHRFESLQHTSHLFGDWIHFYNHQRPHQVLNMSLPLRHSH